VIVTNFEGVKYFENCVLDFDFSCDFFFSKEGIDR